MDTHDCFSVIFHNVREYYSPDNPINCQFSVKENTAIEEPANCCVGILVVAWDSLDNVIAKKSFTSVDLESIGGIYSMTFDLREIAKSNIVVDDDEFYQFCFYSIVTKDVFGASCPFQICSNFKEGSLVHIEEMNNTFDKNMISLTTSSSSVVDGVSWWLKGSDKLLDEDLDDTVLIHNKTTLMENALFNAAKDKEQALMVMKINFENELRQCSSQKNEIIKKSETEVTSLKQKSNLLAERELLLKQNLIDSQNVVKQMEAFAEENTKKTQMLLNNLNLETEVLTKSLADKEAANIAHIVKIKTELNTKIKDSDIKCDDLNKYLFAEKAKFEKMEFEYEEIILNLHKEIELLCIKENESVNETSRSLEELHEKLNFEINKKYEYLNEIDKLSQSVERLTEDNKLRETLLIGEREKLAAMTFQQQEMTSRFGSENEKICAEIENMKSHENRLLEAHRKELLCHRNRIVEMELIAKEDKLKCKSDVDQLNNELNDKINCINILEAKIRETEGDTLDIETHRQEKLVLNDMIDELNTKMVELEQENLQLSGRSKKSSPCQNSEMGSMHALHIANAHMQKQLKTLKKEKETQYSLQKSNESNSDLEKENEEFKLRMCMGKKAFDKQYLECQRLRKELGKLKQSTSTDNASGNHATQGRSNEDEYNSLLLLYNNLKADVAKKNEDLLRKNQEIKEEKEAVEREFIKVTDAHNAALKLNEELRVKMLQLVDHYEGKINLLIEENGMLKTQRAALMQGASSNYVEIKHPTPDIVQTVASSTLEQPNLIQMNRDVIPRSAKQKERIVYGGETRKMNRVVNQQPGMVNSSNVNHPPTTINLNVVEKQPIFLPNVMYPPNMVYQGYLPQDISRPARGEIATPRAVNDPLINAEPPSQVMPNRTFMMTEQHPALNSRGKHTARTPVSDIPTLECPVCGHDFPSNLNEAAKAEHVNKHFES